MVPRPLPLLKVILFGLDVFQNCLRRNGTSARARLVEEGIATPIRNMGVTADQSARFVEFQEVRGDARLSLREELYRVCICSGSSRRSVYRKETGFGMYVGHRVGARNKSR
jgi:hypothetical protein